jgi:competence protein ComEA
MKISLLEGGGGFAAFVRRLVAWRFGALAAKAAAIAAGLVLLALIGRSALAVAGGQSSPATSSSATTASSAPLPVLAPPAASPPESSAAPSPTPSPTPSGRRVATAGDPVFLNQATIDELVRLPGIGQKRAQTILAVRSRLGRFRQLEDLLKVKGIGRATLRRLRPLVRLDAPPVTDAGAPS